MHKPSFSVRDEITLNNMTWKVTLLVARPEEMGDLVGITRTAKGRDLEDLLMPAEFLEILIQTGEVKHYDQ